MNAKRFEGCTHDPFAITVGTDRAVKEVPISRLLQERSDAREVMRRVLDLFGVSEVAHALDHEDGRKTEKMIRAILARIEAD